MIQKPKKCLPSNVGQFRRFLRVNIGKLISLRADAGPAEMLVSFKVDLIVESLKFSELIIASLYGRVDLCEVIFASFKLPVDLCKWVLAKLKSVSADALKLIVASLKLSAKFFELIWSSFRMSVFNCQLTYVSWLVAS